MATTTVQQLPVPDANGAPNGPQAIGDLAREVELLVVMHFGSVADRTSRLSGVGLFDGMVSYLSDLKVFQEVRGGVWVAHNGPMHDEWSGTFTTPLTTPATTSDIGTTGSRTTARALGNITGRVTASAAGILRITNPTPTAELWAVSFITVFTGGAVQVNSWIQLYDNTAAEVVSHSDLTEGENTLSTAGEVVVPAGGSTDVKFQALQRAGTGQTGTNTIAWRAKLTRR